MHLKDELSSLGQIVSVQKLSLDFGPKFRPVIRRTKFEDKIVKGQTTFDDKYFGLFL